jgi:3-oxoacyl-[acyl-carrier-protein] synthase II
MSAAMRRVMVTGIGLLTAIGEGVDETWRSLLAGRSGIRPLSAYRPDSLRTRQGAELVGFDPLRYTGRRTLRMMTGHDKLAMAGGALAMRDAGLGERTGFGPRAGVFVGSNKTMCRPEPVVSAVLSARGADGRADYRKLGETASSLLSPLFYVEGLQPAAVFYLSQAYGFLGANAYFAGTAESGATAIGRATRSVRRGEVDLALAGGFDEAVSWWSMAEMDSLGVLTGDNDAGAAAFRPYDRRRSGSVLGNGAAFLVLEERTAALARGARCYAEVSGVGLGGDGGQVVTPDPAARGLVRAIGAALADAALPADEVSYIASHGCATVAGDRTETLGIRRALGPAADSVAASSVKPQTGHLIGAAGALNVAVAALALNSGVVPPTMHLDEPDPECDLDWVPNVPRRVRLGAALALARGLAGQQVAVALRRA